MDENDFKGAIRLIMSSALAIALIILLWFAAKSAGCDVPGRVEEARTTKAADAAPDAGK